MEISGTSFKTCPACFLISFSHAFQLFVAQHPLVQFFLHPVEEVGAAFVLPAFDVNVETVAVL